MWIGKYKILFALIALSFLTSCEKQGLKCEKSNNPNYDVTFLFEHDGIKVYRFFDGRYHYFTSKGETISTKSRPCGKTRTYYDENIN